MDFNGFTGKEKENIFEDNKHLDRICTDEELYDIVETQKRGRFLIEYVKSSTDKFVTVYNVKKKTVVYKNDAGVSYNLKSKDVERIK